MAFVTNVLILEPIVYCALFVKEDKTGTVADKKKFPFRLRTTHYAMRCVSVSFPFAFSRTMAVS